MAQPIKVEFGERATVHTDWPISLCSNNLTIVTVPLRKGRFYFVAAKKKHTAETSLQLQRQYRKAVLQRQDQLCSEITFPAATPENCFVQRGKKINFGATTLL